MYTCLLFHLADHIFRVSGFRQNLHTQRQRCDSVNWNTLMNGQDISSKFSNGVQNIRSIPGLSSICKIKVTVLPFA